MLDGQLRCINVTKHRVNLLNDDLRLVHSAPYRTRPTARKFDAAKMAKMVTEKVSETATTECAATIVFAHKKNGSTCFCVDYYRLNAVTIRESYPSVEWTNVSTAWENGQRFRHCTPAGDTGR